MWGYTGQERPPFAEPPGPGQESVWDYPRPPKLVVDHRRIVVKRGDLLIADARETYRVLETAGPPTLLVWSLSVWKLELAWNLAFGIWSFRPRAGSILQI